MGSARVKVASRLSVEAAFALLWTACGLGRSRSRASTGCFTSVFLRWAIVLWACTLACSAQAQIFVSGFIDSSTRWAAQSGPYVVSGDMVVRSGAVLEIEAGTQIFMAQGASLTVLAGGVQALGTPARPITVQSDKVRSGQAGTAGDWKNWTFEPGATNTRLDYVVFEHGLGLVIRGSSPTLNYVAIRNHSAPAITMDLAASPVGVGNSATGNVLNGILLPPGDISGNVRWGLRGIPYVVGSGTVSVGASPRVSSITPQIVEQGSTVSVTVQGSRLSGLAGAVSSKPGLDITPFPGGTDSQLALQVQAGATVALGKATLTLQVDAGEVVIPDAITVTQPIPVFGSLAPASIFAGAGPTSLLITGRNFTAGTQVLVNAVAIPSVFVNATEISATLPNQLVLGELQVQLRAPNPLDPAVPLVSGNKVLTVLAPTPPTVSIEPTPIALPPDNKARDVTVRLSKPDYRDNTFTVSVADSSKATVSPQTLLVPAGQTVATISITPKVAGTTSLVLDSTTLARVTVPLFFTTDFRGANTAHSAPVGVVVQGTAPADTQQVTLANRLVGVSVGPVLTQVLPDALKLGTSDTITVRGSGIPLGAVLKLVPATGLSVGTATRSADGTLIQWPVVVAPDALLGARKVVLTDANGNEIVFADPARAALLVMAGLPAIDSMEPNFSLSGKTLQLLVRGKNLQLGRVQLTPDTGIVLDTVPTLSSDGTTLTTTIVIAADAPTGARTVQVVTPAGASTSEAVPANTFTIAKQITSSVSSLASRAVGVVVAASDPVADTGIRQPVSTMVGVLVGTGVLEVSPRTGVIGTDVAVQVRGVGLQTVTEVSLSPAAGITVVGAPTSNADGTQLSFTLRVAADATLGLRQLVLGVSGKPLALSRPEDMSFLIAAPLAELVSVAPQVLVAGQTSVRVTAQGRNFRNVLSARLEPPQGVTILGPFDAATDGSSVSFNATIASDATPGDRTLVVTTAAGDSSLASQPGSLVRIARVAGPTYSNLMSRPVGVVVSTPPVSEVDNRTLVAPLVGVVISAVATDDTVLATPASRTVGVVVGSVAQTMAPSGWLQGASGTVTVEGIGLDTVTSVAVQPNTGLLLGSPTAVNAGARLQFTLSVAPDAPLIARRLRLFSAAGSEVPFLFPETVAVGIGSLPTALTSLSPIVLQQGKTTNLVVRGTNLKSVDGALFEPSSGLSVVGLPVWSQDALGELVTLAVSVDAAAATGPRVIRLTVPGGVTPATATPGNSFNVIPPQ